MESDLPREPTTETAPKPKTEDKALAPFLRMAELGKQLRDLFSDSGNQPTAEISDLLYRFKVKRDR